MRIIAGEFRGRKIKAVPGLKVRPTADKIKEAVFSAIDPLLYGCVFLDVFGGTGSIALEAVSRGAQKAVILEKDRDAQKIITENIALCRAEKSCELLKGDSLQSLRELGRQGMSFDLIYVDPPYRAGIYQEVLKIIAQEKLLNPDGLVLVESLRDNPPDIDINIWQIVKEKFYGITKITTLTRSKEQ